MQTIDHMAYLLKIFFIFTSPHIYMKYEVWMAVIHRVNGTGLRTYERVAVGRKYPCSRPLWICLLWLLLQSLFHVQLGWNFNTKQPLYVQPFCLWPDENPLAWSGAIHHQKKAIILAVNCQSHQYFAHYLVSKVLFKAYITSAGIILPSYETMQPI